MVRQRKTQNPSKPKMNNRMFTARLRKASKPDQKIQLNRQLIVQNISGGKLTKKFSGIVYKTKLGSFNVFRNGKITFVKSQSADDANRALRRFTFKLNKITNIKLKITDFMSRNYVASAKLPHPVDKQMMVSNSVAQRLQGQKMKAVNYTMDQPKGTVLIFDNGSITMIGFKTAAQVNTAYQRLLLQIRPYYIYQN